ncbi:MAG TPA: cytidine deaminase [Planctomycetes bacterium]|nr:cytidine deaminase [Planctomycetota bacterium]
MDVRDSLVQAAREAAERAYAPYSQFKVGAAIRAIDGSIFSGANVENASYPLSLCAERSAISWMIAAGKQEIEAVAIWTDTSEPTLPCGGCRQVLSEFSPNPSSLIITMACPSGERSENLAELLPGPFVLGEHRDV